MIKSFFKKVKAVLENDLLGDDFRAYQRIMVIILIIFAAGVFIYTNVIGG